jgi:hypothetical protein
MWKWILGIGGLLGLGYLISTREPRTPERASENEVSNLIERGILRPEDSQFNVYWDDVLDEVTRIAAPEGSGLPIIIPGETEVYYRIHVPWKYRR